MTGTVTRTDGRPLGGATVAVKGRGLAVSTSPAGRYLLRGVPAGHQILQFRMFGFAARETAVTVTAPGPVTIDATLDPQPVELGAIVIEGASLAPDRLLDTPAAVDVVRPAPGDPLSIMGQVPLALARVPGLDVVLTGVNDFNVNARGFNSALNRGLPVYQDGRDLTVGLQGNQLWTSLAEPLEDLGRIEVIRGPVSALYGANAFKGIINITTPQARDIVGTKITLGGGERSTTRGDLRQAGVWLDDRFGYRFNVGYSRSQDWSRSRTARDTSDWKAEYADATSTPPTSPGPERLPLIGQTRDSVTGRAIGTPAPLINAYGSLRLDYYGARSTVTLEGGTSRAENSINLTSNGRNQLERVIRPWARFAWEANGNNLSGWWIGRWGPRNFRLNPGVTNYNHQNISHLEARTNRAFAGDAGRLVIGASLQQDEENTRGTVLGAAHDDRSDLAYGAYAQVDYRVSPTVRAAGAARFDVGALFDAQLSPKAAIVFTPASGHALRLSVNRAFLTPTPISLFQAAPTGPGVQNLSAIETALRADPAVGPSLSAVAIGTLFTKSAAVPESALGNPRLVPQSVMSYEAGYKGQLGPRVFITLDAYSARIKDFTTGLLPAGTTGLHQDYQPWTAPAQVPTGERAKVEAAVYQALNARGSTVRNGLTRLADGTTAVVLSYGNAGTVDEWGIEFGSSVLLTGALSFNTSYTWFNAAIRQNIAGNVLSPNTPHNKGTVALSYAGSEGLSADVDVRMVERYHWTSGIYDGDIPTSQTVNANAAWRVNPHVRVYATATNLLDQQRFQIYGGSVIGRRVLVGTTWSF